MTDNEMSKGVMILMKLGKENKLKGLYKNVQAFPLKQSLEFVHVNLKDSLRVKKNVSPMIRLGSFYNLLIRVGM